MRGFRNIRAGLATAALAALVAACGDEPCNHVISDVPTFKDCQAIAVERGCSDEVTYSKANPDNGKPSRCKVEDCGDCNGPRPTPTASPVP